MGDLVYRVLRRFVEIDRSEVQSVGWTWVYFYAVFASYYVIRPIRDEAAVAGGVVNLPFLFAGTLIATALANPAFSALVTRLPRVVFVSWTHRFFMVNLLVFFLLLHGSAGSENIWVGRAFYVWTSVFNLFVPSVFWAFMTDVFTREQAKRLFGVISAAGTLGALTGAGLTATLVAFVPPVWILFVSIAFLEVVVLAVRSLSRLSESLRMARGKDSHERPIGGTTLAGIKHALSSPYLLGIGVYMLMYTVLNTFLYFAQAELVDQTFTDRAERTAYFARVDFLTNLLTFVLQTFALGRLLRVIGVTLTLAVMPVVSAIGFFTMGLMPVAAVIIWFQSLRRATEYSIARPTREVLFTVVPREDRYKAKSFIDTFVYRTGDQLGAWLNGGLLAFGFSLGTISFIAVPMAVFWLVNGFWVGRRHEQLATKSTETD
jgi:ATP:ADP antiporter, AAA family